MVTGSQGLAVAEVEAEYLSLRILSVYSNLSVRTLRTYLVHRSRPLPHYRLGSKILVKRAEFDAWMNAFHTVESNQVDAMVTEIMNGA